MTSQEILRKICGEYTAVNLQCSIFYDSRPDDEYGDLRVEQTVVANVKINIAINAITAILTFDTQSDYDTFIKTMNQMEAIQVAPGSYKANVITFSPWQDDIPGEQIYAAGYISMWMSSDAQKAAQFVFSPEDFDVFSLSLDIEDEEPEQTNYAADKTDDEDWLDN